MVTSLRSGFHVLVFLVNMKAFEELAINYFRRIDSVIICK